MKAARIIGSVGALATAFAGLAVTAPAAGAAGVIEMASVDATGAPLHKSHHVSISDDGRFVAFVAQSDSGRNLVLRDRATATTTEIDPGPTQYPRVSGDGSVVVFQSGFAAVRAFDRTSGTTSLVSVSPTGATPTSNANAVPGGVSHGGRFVAFTYRDPSYGVNGVYLRDRTAGTTELVSVVDPTLGPTAFGPGSVSDDGNTVAFSANVRLPGHPRSEFQAFVWTRSTGSAAIVSLDEGGAPALSSVFVDDMTPDGRFVAIETDARLAAADPNTGVRDVYVRDLATGTTSYVGANFPDDAYDSIGMNTAASLSDDGRHVAFVTDALIAGKWTHDTDVVVADRVAGTLAVASLALDGTPAGSVDPQVELSGDGRFLAFASSARTLVPPFDTSECVEMEENDDEDNPWPPFIETYGECSNAYVLDRAATGGMVTGGGTLSDGSTSVQLPPGVSGTVTIAPTTGSEPVPEGYEILGQQLVIEAPTATWDNPLRLSFTVPASEGVPAEDIAVIRDGVPVADCIGAVDALPPDTASADGHPCITSRTTASDGSVLLVVLTPHASVWSVAKVPATATVTYASLAEATQAAVSSKGIAQSLCAKLAAASASAERGDGPSAARQLEAYRNELSAQSGKWVTAEDAAELIEQSRLL